MTVAVFVAVVFVVVAMVFVVGVVVVVVIAIAIVDIFSAESTTQLLKHLKKPLLSDIQCCILDSGVRIRLLSKFALSFVG